MDWQKKMKGREYNRNYWVPVDRIKDHTKYTSWTQKINCLRSMEINNNRCGAFNDSFLEIIFILNIKTSRCRWRIKSFTQLVPCDSRYKAWILMAYWILLKYFVQGGTGPPAWNANTDGKTSGQMTTCHDLYLVKM